MEKSADFEAVFFVKPGQRSPAAACWLTASRQRSMICSMADSVKVQRNLRAAMKEALRIQDRFVAEPVFRENRPRLSQKRGRQHYPKNQS